jgi:hypothetical protein
MESWYVEEVLGTEPLKEGLDKACL